MVNRDGVQRPLFEDCEWWDRHPVGLDGPAVSVDGPTAQDGRAGEGAPGEAGIISSTGTTAATTTATAGSTASRTWTERPGAARLLGATVAITPPLAALVGTVVLNGAFAPTSGTLTNVVRFALLVAASLVIHLAVRRLLRGLLPLTALLRLSLTFPDQAPSRFAVALRANRAHHLRRRLAGQPTPARPGRIQAPRPRADPGVADPPAEVAMDLLAVVARLTVHDPKTRGHAERVRAYADLIGAELGLTATERTQLSWAALLHDAGKLGVPGSVLNKEGRLDDTEWDLVRAHPVEGDRIVAPLAPFLGGFAAVCRQHHERWDGTGYPAGLAGSDICLGARIVAVADAFDVMTSVRSYQASRSFTEARAELVRCAGSHFDPAVVRAMLNAGIEPAAWRTGGVAAVLAPVGLALSHWPRPVREVARPLGLGAALGALVMAGLVHLDDPDPSLLAATPPPTTASAGRMAMPPPPTQPPAAPASTVAPSTTTPPVTTAPVTTVPPPAPVPPTTVTAGAPTAPSPTTTMAAVVPELPPTTATTLLSSMPVPTTLRLDLAEDAGPTRLRLLPEGPSLDPITVRLTDLPRLGRASLDDQGWLTYTPSVDAHGDDGVGYQLCVGARCVDASVAVVLRPVDDPPTAGDDVAAITAAGATEVDVLANDVDVDGDDLRVLAVTAAAHGTTSLDAGRVRYVPTPGHRGSDRFTYVVSDGNNAVTGTVDVDVDVPDRAPLSIAPGRLSVAGGGRGDVDVTALVEDPDGGPVQVLSTTAPLFGVSAVVDGPTPGAPVVRYVPGVGMSGFDTFDVLVAGIDGAVLRSTVTVEVTPVVGSPTLLLSTRSDRGDAVALEGTATLTGPVAIFLRPDAGVVLAEFFLDDPTAGSTPYRRELATPFDLASTAADGSAVLFDPTVLIPGSHLLTVRVTTTDGVVRTLNHRLGV